MKSRGWGWQAAWRAWHGNVTARAFVLYAVAFALAGATPLLLLPILTRLLSPAELGIATGFLIATLLIANVAGMSAHGAVSVRYFKMERPAFARLVGVALLVVLIAHGALLAGMLPALGWLEASFELPASVWLLAALAAVLLSFSQVFLAICQVSGQPEAYLRIRALQSVTEFAMCAGLLLFVLQDERARVYSYLAAVGLAAAYGFLLSRRREFVATGGGREELGTVLRYGAPMLPHVLGGTLITYLDRVIVGVAIGAEGLGLYSAAAQIGMAMMLLIEPLNKALMPWLYGKLALDDAAVKREVVRLTYLGYGALIVIGALVAGAGVLFFEFIVGPEYRSAKLLVPFIVLGFVFQGMYYSVVNYVCYAEKTAYLSLSTGSVVVAGALINYALVLGFGLVGAAIAFALTNLLLFLATWWLSTRAVRMPWSLRT